METVTTLSRRMERVEYALERLATQAEQTDRQVERVGQRLEDFMEDMHDFKQEMRDMSIRNDEEHQKFRQEIQERDRKSDEEHQKFRQEIQERDQRNEIEWRKYRQEMQERDRKVEERNQTNEMEWRKYRQEMQERDRKAEERNQTNAMEWRKYRQEVARLSHKMGTLVEDLVAPSIPRILREVVGCTEVPRLEAMRLKKKRGGRSQEYDTIAICGEYMLINETKSRLVPSDVTNFVKTLEEAREFLDDFGQYKIVGALATFYVDESLVVHGERQGLIMLNAGDGLMTVLNSDGFVPKAY